MPEIRPFRGVRYNPGVIGDMGAVIAPPYDIVSPAMRARLVAAHPRNMIRLELPQAEGGADPTAGPHPALRPVRSLKDQDQDVPRLGYGDNARYDGKATSFHITVLLARLHTGSRAAAPFRD